MSIYQATTPPPGSTCQRANCCSQAMVRVVIPPSRFTADGLPHDDGDGQPVSRDICELHWPELRDLFTRNGHTITDTTGDLRALARDFPAWHVFTSDSGRLYASRTLRGGQGITVHAYLIGHLRAQMQQADETEEQEQMAHHGQR